MLKSWKQYQKLHQKKYRQEMHLFPVEGTRLCREALDSGWKIEAAFFNDDFGGHPDFKEFQRLLSGRNIEIQTIGSENFRRLAATENPQGILLVVEMPDSPPSPELLLRDKKFVLVLDAIRDPGNMGTLLRTADWFGVQLVISTPDSVDLYNDKVIRSSMGSCFHLPNFEAANPDEIVTLLKKGRFQIVGTAVQGGMPVNSLKLNPPVALVLGSEAEGMSPHFQEIADTTVSIPKFGKAESLNVAIAGGILMSNLAPQIQR